MSVIAPTSESSHFEFKDLGYVNDSMGQNMVYCLSHLPPMHSNGVWNGDDPFSYLMPGTMFHFILFFVISQAVYRFLRPLRQHRFVCNMLAGIIIGPSLIGRNATIAKKLRPPELELITNTLASMSASFYVFIVSVKINFDLIQRMGSKTYKIGITSIVVPFITVIFFVGILRYVDYDFQEVRTLMLLAFNLSVTYCTDIAAALDELNLLTSELGQLSLSSSLLSDVVTWIYVVVGHILKQPTLLCSLKISLATCVMMVFVICVLRPTMLWVVKKTPKGQLVKEIYVTFILLGVLVMRVISENVVGNSILGPMLFGLTIPSGPPLGSVIAERTELIISDILMPFFYLEVGAHIDVFAMNDWKIILRFEGLVLLTYFAKFAGTLFASLSSKMTLRESFIVSLIMSTRGTLEVMGYRFWRINKLSDQRYHSPLVISTVAQTVINTPLVYLLYKPNSQFDYPTVTRGRDLQLMRQNPELRVLACIHSEDDVPGIITLVEASNPTKESPICSYVVHLVELHGLVAPLLVPHDKHSTICSHNGCHRILTAFENYSNNSNGLVVVLPFTTISPVRTMHEGVCRLAKEKLVDIILIPYCINEVKQGEKEGALNRLTALTQAYAPCTVGILVDQSHHVHMTRNTLVYHVAVIFIGGIDDREALAYATRMLGHEGVTCTIFRISVRNEKTSDGGDDEELTIDNSMIDEFKLRNMNNGRAIYHHLIIEDWEQVTREIQSSAVNFDIVMVGKQQATTSGLEPQMACWSKNAELGVIGDMIASSGSSVLVLQHCRYASNGLKESGLKERRNDEQKKFFSAPSVTTEKERSDFSIA